ncbi:hypothetical protein EJ04DRAFT_591650 [Polyplosphaeria fusca]|uniref:Uncharacterized protein n=1 Tax=Polyplosphaeria fusca TaxID=682080 RepID=A0A9P4UU11_9PLEO|nr:hypothetical protein EJ04DRAFT_591650 [Polyplosphaeria fusca]
MSHHPHHSHLGHHLPPSHHHSSLPSNGPPLILIDIDRQSGSIAAQLREIHHLRRVSNHMTSKRDQLANDGIHSYIYASIKVIKEDIAGLRKNVSNITEDDCKKGLMAHRCPPEMLQKELKTFTADLKERANKFDQKLKEMEKEI